MKRVQLSRQLRQECLKNRKLNQVLAMQRGRQERLSNNNSTSSSNNSSDSSFASAVSSRETSPVHINVNVNLNQKQQNTVYLINDFQKNLKRHKNGRRWFKETIKIFSILSLICGTALTVLSQMVIIPGRETIRNFNNINEMHLTKPINQINNIESFPQSYRSTYNVSDENKIDAILAVDAISLDPYVKVLENGTVTGVFKDTNLTKEQIEELRHEIKRQETYINTLKNVTVSSAFVYQIQPLNPMYPCSVVFIEPSNNGKAAYKQIQNLIQIRDVFQENGFQILAFASDGDSAYKWLTNKTLSKHQLLTRPIIDTDEYLYTNDPLHLLKRARYRFLTHNFTLLLKNQTYFNFSDIKDIFNIPKLAFNNARITKMQDSLPIRLFTLANLKLLIDIEYLQFAAYFLPFCLFNTAFQYETLLIDERVDLLEITFYYLELYKQLMVSEKKQNLAPQKGSKAVILFDTGLIDDMLSTIITINTIMKNYIGPISMNRIGTNPLEHHFGLLRMKAKFKHDWENILRNEKKLKVLEVLKNDMISEHIRTRCSSYGPVLFLENRNKGSSTNLLVAQSLLQKFNIPLKKKLSGIQSDTGFTIFISKINQLIENEKIPMKSTVFSSKDIKINPSAGAYIQKRQDFSKFKNDDDISNHQPNPISISSSSDNEYDDFNDAQRKISNKRLFSESQP